MTSIIKLNEFVELKLCWGPHTYHNEGSNCIYQDLAKNKNTIREIIYKIKNNKDYLSRYKYQKSADKKMRVDHMLHYINCIEYGFVKNIRGWREHSNEENMNIHESTYKNSVKMSDSEIDKFLQENPISINSDNTLTDGNHRILCMVGRLLKGEKYIPFRTKKNTKIHIINNYLPVVGYRTKSSRHRLVKIMENINESHVTAIDIGSNYGYFSTNIALNNLDSFVISFEGSFGTGNSGNKAINSNGIKTHLETIKRNNIYNNRVIPQLFTIDIIDNLINNHIVFNYTLLLSVFHWIVFGIYKNNATIQQVEDLFVKCLKISKTIFLELPEKNQRTSVSTIYDEYKTLPFFLNYIKEKYFKTLTYKLLTSSEWYGKRDLYIISHDIETSPINIIMSLNF
tara:strand:- start:9995 stop:11188 length:1194 start_codon:yes stop_codon:yes gene_type:complete